MLNAVVAMLLGVDESTLNIDEACTVPFSASVDTVRGQSANGYCYGTQSIRGYNIEICGEGQSKLLHLYRSVDPSYMDGFNPYRENQYKLRMKLHSICPPPTDYDGRWIHCERQCSGYYRLRYDGITEDTDLLPGADMLVEAFLKLHNSDEFFVQFDWHDWIRPYGPIIHPRLRRRLKAFHEASQALVERGCRPCEPNDDHLSLFNTLLNYVELWRRHTTFSDELCVDHKYVFQRLCLEHTSWDSRSIDYLTTHYKYVTRMR